MTSASATLQGKTAIVTGSSRGIGRQIALELARRGSNVVITFTSANSAALVDDMIAEIENMGNGASAIKVQGDLRMVETPSKIVKACRGEYGDSIDILVNNAGTDSTKALADITADDYSAVFGLNVRATLLMTQAVAPHLRKPGCIVNISSVAGRSGFAPMALYCSSKAAQEGMTRALARELGAQGHTVNAVEPGPVEGEMIERIPQELVNMQKKLTPVENRLGTTDAIAQVVSFLCEERARWISGQTISASGGWLML